MGRQVLRTGPDRLDVLGQERRIERLAGHDPAHAAVHLQGADRGHDHGRVGLEARGAALDVEELLGAHVRPEAGLGAHDLVGGQGQPVGEDRVVAVGDVRERAAMDEGRAALEGLEQVGLDRIDEQDGHRPGDLEVLEGDRLAVHVRGHHHPAEPGAQVLEVGRQGEDRHHLGGDRDHRLGLARHAVLAAAQADDRPPQGPVADVDDARPGDRERVDPELVAVIDRVVEERRGQVVGGADRVDVAGQVEVEVLHRDDLAVAAAGGAALDPEDRPERRLADRHRRPLADPVQALGQADRGRRLALAERRRRDPGDHDVLAPRVGRLEPLDRRQGHLRLARSVLLDLVVAQAQVVGDVDDRPRGDRAGDLEVRGEAHWEATPAAMAEVERTEVAWAKADWAIAASRTWVISRAFVTGPTPPGTG